MEWKQVFRQTLKAERPTDKQTEKKTDTEKQTLIKHLLLADFQLNLILRAPCSNRLI